ncbi:MAG: hypothetical protein K2Q33_06275 [Gammaproteobacteria bacterium]|nr:hypothetical protein [Gammaproteobacteria bacterium]
MVTEEIVSAQVEECEIVYAKKGEQDNGRINRLLIPVIAEDSDRVQTFDAALDRQIGYARENITVNNEALGEGESTARALRAALQERNVEKDLIDFLIRSGRIGVLYNPLGTKIDQAFAGHYVFLTREASEVSIHYAVQEDGSVLVPILFLVNIWKRVNNMSIQSIKRA